MMGGATGTHRRCQGTVELRFCTCTKRQWTRHKHPKATAAHPVPSCRRRTCCCSSCGVLPPVRERDDRAQRSGQPGRRRPPPPASTANALNNQPESGHRTNARGAVKPRP
jgi:hypothetical protein